MIPDLGKYAGVVGWSYAVSLVLMVGLVWLTLRQGKRVKRTLHDMERRHEAQKQDTSHG